MTHEIVPLEKKSLLKIAGEPFFGVFKLQTKFLTKGTKNHQLKKRPVVSVKAVAGVSDFNVKQHFFHGKSKVWGSFFSNATGKHSQEHFCPGLTVHGTSNDPSINSLIALILVF